jgi:hypothetical protein
MKVSRVSGERSTCSYLFGGYRDILASPVGAFITLSGVARLTWGVEALALIVHVEEAADSYGGFGRDRSDRVDFRRRPERPELRAAGGAGRRRRATVQRLDAFRTRPSA